jgi:multiple sugar transport system permease protein
VWSDINYPLHFLNSLKLSVIITLIQLFTCSLAAYSFSKLHFPGRDKIFLGYLATMMIPWHAIMIPQFVIIKALNLYNTHMALIMLHAFSAFGVFLLRQSMLGIPGSLSEAATIDGCGTFRIYWNIILPLTKTGLATLSVLTFNFIWNDYMGPMIYLDAEALKTIQIALASFN